MTSPIIHPVTIPAIAPPDKPPASESPLSMSIDGNKNNDCTDISDACVTSDISSAHDTNATSDTSSASDTNATSDTSSASDTNATSDTSSA